MAWAHPDERVLLLDIVDDYSERLRKLEASSGGALSITVAALQARANDNQGACYRNW